MAPQKMKAIKIIEGNKAELQEVPLPKIRDDYLLCKVKCIALNPTDWKHIDIVGKPGSTVGCDFSGVVEEVGSKVEGWKKGDRIAGMTHGGNQSNQEDGSFAEYCMAKAGLGLKISDSMSDEDAATLGVGVITCGQALYQSLGLPLPGEGKYGGYLLVYGGSTASGTLAIQYAVLSGCKVITTASERNWPMLKKLGAEATFDYKDPDCAKKIREYTNDSLTLVMDCIAEGDSPKICEEAISSKGGAISYLLNAKHTRTDVENKHTFGYTIFGEDFEKRGNKWTAKPEDYEHAKKFWVITKKLLEDGKLKTHPTKVEKNGLVGAFDGFQQFRDAKVSGVKLVYRVEETP